ncbi:hypothetical protein J6590_083456 [Homalodisca vitripennis]|nr:hypothetical protein J6590_083456 [Homalodisca vitripennis]
MFGKLNICEIGASDHICNEFTRLKLTDMSGHVKFFSMANPKHLGTMLPTSESVIPPPSTSPQDGTKIRFIRLHRNSSKILPRRDFKFGKSELGELVVLLPRSDED